MKGLSLRLSILAVVLFAAISFFAYWKGWYSDFSLNLGTELIGILVTVLFIDLVVSRHERLERKKLRNIALRQMRVPIQRHLNLLFNFYKASVLEPRREKIDGPETLFSEDYYFQLAWFDLGKDAPVIPKQRWMDYICVEVNGFRDSLSRTLEKYAMHLDPETIDLLENLLNSSLLSFLLQVPIVSSIDRSEGYGRKYVFFGAPGMKDMVMEHANLFTRLVAIYNEAVADDQHIHLSEGIWRDDVSPKIGSARTSA